MLHMGNGNISWLSFTTLAYSWIWNKNLMMKYTNNAVYIQLAFYMYILYINTVLF